MRYLDSGTRAQGETLYGWLATALKDAEYFACQTGYFSSDGLYPVEKQLVTMLEAGGEAHFVLGANQDGLRRTDVESVLDLIEPHGPRASLVIASAPNALMHPKVFYVESDGGRKQALVGSANFTRGGLAYNIEAGISLDSNMDSAAPLDDIRKAIDVWRHGSRPNGRVVDRSDLDKLVAARVLDRPKPPRPKISKKARRRMLKLFPSLDAAVVLPKRPRPAKTITPPVRTVKLRGAQSLPPGMVGIVKRLSSLDTKGFRGASGTAYVALPVDLLPFLPAKPAGKNSEPRWDIEIEASLDTVPNRVVHSGAVPTSITGVGMGPARKSHRDLRLNMLKVVAGGISYLAAQAGVSVPSAGDALCVELMPGNTVRLKFITANPDRARALALCTSSRSSWGWLPNGYC